MKINIILALILVFLISSCSEQKGKCGDGTCDEVEQRTGICPEDCGEDSIGDMPRGDIGDRRDQGNMDPKSGDGAVGSKLCGDGTCDDIEQREGICPGDCGGSDVDLGDGNPYYFIAIHNEPYHDSPLPLGEEQYNNLKQIIEKANEYNMKITIMLTPQWVDIVEQDDIDAWVEQGHEISSHHHGVYHPNWDGYTDFSEEEYTEMRKEKIGNREIEPYLGTLDDLYVISTNEF